MGYLLPAFCIIVKSAARYAVLITVTAMRVSESDNKLFTYPA